MARPGAPAPRQERRLGPRARERADSRLPRTSHRDLASVDDKVRLALKATTELFGETKVSAFRPAAFKAIPVKMIESGLSITTIRDRRGVIRRMVAWGVENEIAPADALQRI